MIQLILGGSGSGKSAFAEKRLAECSGQKKYYIATMQVYGEEGRKKVERHHRLREGKGFLTIEQQTDVSLAVEKMENAGESSVLLECLSNLAANEMFRENEILSTRQVTEKIMREIRILAEQTGDLILVSNQVFEDGITYEQTTLDYMKALGRINREIAEMADEVVELVVGIPIVLKQNVSRR